LLELEIVAELKLFVCRVTIMEYFTLSRSFSDFDVMQYDNRRMNMTSVPLMSKYVNLDIPPYMLCH